jgi:hypothetical protein
VRPSSRLDTTVQPVDGKASDQQTFAERMAHDYQMKQYEDLSNRWYAKALLYSEKVRAKLFTVLKFPMGGWMTDMEDETASDDLIDEDNEDETNNEMDDEDVDMGRGGVRSTKLTLVDAQARSAQLLGIRKFYVPSICFVLVDMLGKMNLNKELIRLSDIVAAEDYRLYEMFEKAQLRSFLNKVANASINLLDSNLDYLGYN